jgi:hypothetical protein
MDRAGYDKHPSAQPDLLQASYDDKQDAPSSLSSNSIRTHDRQTGAESEAAENEKGQETAGAAGGNVDGVAGNEEGKLSLQRSKSVTNAASIPDGGMWAWLQVLGAFFLLFNSWCVLPYFASKVHINVYDKLAD